jgi:competence protein ComEA
MPHRFRFNLDRFRFSLDRKLAFVLAVIAAAGAFALVRGSLFPSSAPALEIRDAGAASSRERVAGVDDRTGTMPRAVRPDEPVSVVYVTGAVARGGVYALRGAPRIVDALARAGGASSDADLTAINLAHRVEDGEMVFVPRRGAAADAERVAALDEGPQPQASSTAHRRHRKRRSHRKRTSSDIASNDAAAQSSTDAANGAYESGTMTTTDAPPRHRRRHHRAKPIPADGVTVIDVNTADANALAELPGIGLDLAERIVDFRDLNGPFASPDELLDVAGITPSILDEITPYVTLR